MLNETNLLKIAVKLDTLPDGYEAFEMAYFLAKAKRERCYDYQIEAEVEKNYALHNGGVDTCGAVACAVGHGPAAGILVPEDLVHTDGRVDWTGYIDRFLINGYADSEPWEPATWAFEWMFAGEWSDIDNTPRGAAKRIRWLLANGVHALPLTEDDDGERQMIPHRNHMALYADA